MHSRLFDEAHDILFLNKFIEFLTQFLTYECGKCKDLLQAT